MLPVDLNTLATLLPTMASIVGKDDPIQNPHIMRRNYAQGGVVNAEGGEIMQVPGGPAQKLQGPDHSGGGVDVAVPGGTTFFSKRVKGPDGRTMAARKESRERLLAKLQKDLASNPTDVIHKAAAKRGFETAVMEELEDIAIMQNEFNKTQQKSKSKVKMVTGGEPFPGSYFYGESPAKPRKVAKGYSWEQEFDPYFFQKAYFKDQPDQWDNVVGPNTTKAMATPEGQKLLQEMAEQYQTINTPGEVGPNGIPMARQNILHQQDPITAEVDPITVDMSSADINATMPGMYSPVEAASVLYVDPGTEDPYAGYSADPNAVPAPAGGATSDISAADIASVAGPIGKTLVTIGNRLGDRPTPNYYADYGTEALQLGRKTIEGAAAQRDLDLQSNNALVNALRRNRSGRSVNAARAYDVATLTQAGRNANRISASFRQALADATNRVGAMAANRDRMLAEGKKFADVTDTQNRDAFATNLGQNIGDITTGIQHREKNRLRRKLGITNEASAVWESLIELYNTMFGG